MDNLISAAVLAIYSCFVHITARQVCQKTLSNIQYSLLGLLRNAQV